MIVAGLELIGARPVGGGDICRSFQASTPDGATVFVKTLAGAPAGFFEAEAAGLDRLRVAGGPPVPAVRAAGPDGLVLDWVESGRPNPAAAARFGRALAELHGFSASTYGATTGGFVATVPLDNAPATDWPSFQAERRLSPALELARDRGAIRAEDAAAVEAVIARLAELAGPAQPPALLHGDLWAGNLHWGADEQVWLVDAAAAHHGHRETDLAMLALFGAPMLAEIDAAYADVLPHAPGRPARVSLHQIHPLLVHAALFGGGYGRSAGAAARAALAVGG
jgi:fructosamine-3-kinase